MENAIVSAAQVTPEWLTAVLREKGSLPRGQVTRVTPGVGRTTFASGVWHLEVAYSPDASLSAPRRLFLKVSNPSLAPGDFDPQRLRQEIVFYREVAPAMDGAFMLPCYDAVYEPETGASHLLLKDVSETHAAGLTPTYQRNCERSVDVLASLHAFWWDHPRLGKGVGTFPTQEERRKEWNDTKQCTTAFMAALGDQLSPSRRATYERVLPALPDLYKRHATGRNLTLVHGDSHPGNFLYPQDAGDETTYLIDWQFWHPTIGGTDLAFMMVTEWEPEIRQQLEQTLLRRYYRGLIERGVQGYQWEDCWNDYRLSVILVSILIPVWRWAVFRWEPDMLALDRSMTAFDELACSDLLGRA